MRQKSEAGKCATTKMAKKKSMSLIIWYVKKDWVKMRILKRFKKGPFQGVKYGKNEDVAKYVI